MRREKHSSLAALYAIGAFTCFVASDTLIKMTGSALSVDQQILINKFVLVLVCLAAVWRKQGLREIKTTKRVFHFVRGLIVIGNMSACFYGVTHLPLANFYTINFTAPFMVSLLSVIFLKESPSIGVWLAILTGFVGVLIAVRPDRYDALTWPLWPVIVLLAGNFCFALYSLTIKWGGHGESNSSLVFYPELVAFTVLFICVAARSRWPHDMQAVVLVMASGLFSGLAALSLTAAYRRAMNALVAPFHYTQIITGSLVGYVFWGDVPTQQGLIGVAIIMVSGFYLMRHSRRSEEAMIVP